MNIAWVISIVLTMDAYIFSSFYGCDTRILLDFIT